MHLNRRILGAMLFLPVLLGAGMAFDHRFLSLHDMRNSLVAALFIYLPTLLFFILGLNRFIRGGIRLPVVFAIGIVATGLFHQAIAKDTYGNPGYMVPMGHIAAPFVSLAAYLLSWVAVWLVGKLFQSKKIDPAAP